MQLRLRRVFFDMDLRRGGDTNWAEVLKKKELPASMKGDHCIMFLNRARTMMDFAFCPIEWSAENHIGREVHARAVRWMRVKIRGTTWSPDMLANYAADAGIELIGIRSFQSIWKEYRDAA